MRSFVRAVPPSGHTHGTCSLLRVIVDDTELTIDVPLVYQNISTLILRKAGCSLTMLSKQSWLPGVDMRVIKRTGLACFSFDSETSVQLDREQISEN